ncbi:MAG: methyltransferase domain-containing protein [Marinicaulis sp.]|nr:methyltransferase domain-containing protein [Marinicaulis sp.]
MNPFVTENTPPTIFDRKRLRLRRARSAASHGADDFLHQRAMADIVDRLETVNRSFNTAVFYGASNLTGMLTQRCDVGEIIQCDLARERLAGCERRVIFDDEHLPLADASVNLFVSVLTLHSTNDLVGALAQIRKALKPDGLFIAAMFGENTLRGLRAAITAAQSDKGNGFQARFSPMAAIQDLGAAMMRAGFTLPALDIDRVNVVYNDPMKLIADLRGMGETNILSGVIRPLTREVFAEAMARFAADGGTENFEIVYLTGWAPHPDQQKPLQPGSAKASLKDAIEKNIT